MGGRTISVLGIGLLVSALVVVLGGVLGRGVPVGEGASSDREASNETVPVGTRAEKRWNEIYRGVLTTPQSMIGGFAASDAAVDEFVARARPVAPEVSEAWKTVMRLKSGVWDVQTCARYQRARFVICAHEQAEGCKAQLERELSDCDECATDGACGNR